MKRSDSLLYIAMIVLFAIIIVSALNTNMLSNQKQIEYVNNDAEYERTNDGVMVKATSYIGIKDGTIMYEFNIPNDTSNKYAIDAIIVIDGDIIVYESGLIYPGETKDELKISTEIPVGTYSNSFLIYKFYTIDEPHEFVGRCDFPIEVNCFE